jgi:class 3 adenylate cyclase
MRKTVVELDLVGYSSIVKMLEENLDVKTVTHLNQQIQGFVNTGLMAVSEMRERVVIASNGDNAVIIFDDATYAYNFAKAVHEYTQLHNASKTEPSAKRWFRIGAATGELAQEDNGKLTGYVIVTAYRLEANANPGEFIVDLDTYNALPDELKQRFDSEETVLGKHDKKFKARRCKMIFNTNLSTNEPIEIEVLDLFGQLKPQDQIQQIMTLIAMPQEHRPPDTLTIFQRQGKILDWAANNNTLENLKNKLLYLIGKQHHPQKAHWN